MYHTLQACYNNGQTFLLPGGEIQPIPDLPLARAQARSLCMGPATTMRILTRPLIGCKSLAASRQQTPTCCAMLRPLSVLLQ